MSDLDYPSFCITPYPILVNPNLSAEEKLQFGIITGLCHKEGYCWASDEQLAEMRGVCIRTMQRWLQKLEDEGLIRRTSENKPYRNEDNKLRWCTHRKIYVNLSFQNNFAGTTKMSTPNGHDKNVHPERARQKCRATNNTSSTQKVLKQTQEASPCSSKEKVKSVPKPRGKCLTAHDAVTKHSLTKEQEDTLRWLVSLKLGSNIDTLARWAKTQQRANLEAMYQKSKDKASPGAYMMKLVKQNVELATDHSNQNKKTASLFQQIKGKTRVILKDLYALIVNENGAEKEASYSLPQETFVDILENNLGPISQSR